MATINPDGSDLRYLTHFNAGGAAAFTGSYSPDGQWIVFRLQSRSTSTFGLFKMRPDGTRRTLIAELPFAPRFIDWGLTLSATGRTRLKFGALSAAVLDGSPALSRL